MERQTTGLTRAQYSALYRALSNFDTNCRVAIQLNKIPEVLPWDLQHLAQAEEALRVLDALPLDTANWIETMEKKAA